MSLHALHLCTAHPCVSVHCHPALDIKWHICDHCQAYLVRVREDLWAMAGRLVNSRPICSICGKFHLDSQCNQPGAPQRAPQGGGAQGGQRGGDRFQPPCWREQRPASRSTTTPTASKAAALPTPAGMHTYIHAHTHHARMHAHIMRVYVHGRIHIHTHTRAHTVCPHILCASGSRLASTSRGMDLRPSVCRAHICTTRASPPCPRLSRSNIRRSQLHLLPPALPPARLVGVSVVTCRRDASTPLWSSFVPTLAL